MDLWLGIDGGGTKTDFQLVASDGRILGELTLGGINPNYCAEEEVLAMLEKGRRRLFSAAGLDEGLSLCGTIMCMAGFSIQFLQRFRDLPKFGEGFFSGDHLPMLELCGGEEGCLVVHSGTGSFVSGRLRDAPISYWGGYGYILSDPGSGSDIGRRAVRRSFEELTGVAPKTAFGEHIRNFYGFRHFDHLVEVVYGSPSPAGTLARCVREVVGLFEEGDALAREILSESLGELAVLAAQVGGGLLSAGCRQGLSGGVLTVPSVAEIMRQELRTRGLPGAWHPLTERPIEGVRRMLVQWARGRHPDRHLREDVRALV